MKVTVKWHIALILKKKNLLHVGIEIISKLIDSIMIE